MSLIRAAEIYIWPLHELHRRQMAGDDWSAEFVPPSADESAREAQQLDVYAARQEALCVEMGLTRSDWLYLGTRLQRRWEAAEADNEAEAAQAEEDHDTAGAAEVDGTED